jgi:hypothetical protein
MSHDATNKRIADVQARVAHVVEHFDAEKPRRAVAIACEELADWLGLRGFYQACVQRHLADAVPGTAADLPRTVRLQSIFSRAAASYLEGGCPADVLIDEAARVAVEVTA